MNHMKRLAAFLLAAIMVFSLLPTTAMATEDGATPVCSGEATGCTGDVHVHPCPLYVAPGCTECGQTEGHADTCTVPCTMQGNCTSAAHKEGCKSQIVCDACGEKGGSHKADCTVPCTGEAGCTSAAHKEGCKSLYCEHDVLKTETCGECAASAARIKAVQDLIDALPETVTNDDEAAALEAAFNAIDAAKAGLSEAEIGKLNIAKHTAALSALDAFKGQPDASVPEAAVIADKDSLVAAILAATDGQIITLTGSFTADGKIEIPADKNVTIEMNGKTLTGAFIVHGKATIQNGTIINESNISGVEVNNNETGASADAEMTLINMTVTSNRHAVRVDGGKATIKSGIYTTTADSSTSGYALNVNSSSATEVVVDGGKFYGSATGKVSGKSAVTVQNANCKITINSGEFYSGATSGTAYSVENYSPASKITGGTFTGGLVNSYQNISGGTFDTNVSNMAAPGMVAVMKNGKFQVIYPISNTTTGKGYPTLAAAFAEAGEADVILLEDDIHLTEPAVVPADKTVTLDLNGKTITNTTPIWTATNNALIQVNGKLTINDSVGTGKVHAMANDCYAADLKNGGELIINGGSYLGNWSTVYVRKSTLVINAGHFDMTQLGGPNNDSREFLINAKDEDYTAGETNITINGGSFVGFNPSNNAAEGAHTNYAVTGKAGQKDANGVYTLVPAAAVNTSTGAAYATLAEALADVASGDTVTLLADLDLTAPAVVPSGKAIILDLNGKTITNTKPIWSGTNNALIQVNGKLTINDSDGTGKVHALANDCYAADLKDGGELIINGGSYLGNWSTVYVRKSILVINGGHFDMTQLNDDGTKDHLINAKDVDYNSNDARITINGGSFVGFNPSNNSAESGGHANFAKEGFAGKATNGVYTLVEAAAVNTSTGAAYATFAEALADVGTGETIKLLKNVAENFTLAKSITLDLNTKKLTGTVNINSDQIQLTIAAPSNNTLVHLASTATKAGYALGWQKDGTAISGSTINAAGTYSIKWVANTYTIRYNLNGGALAAGVTNPTSYTTDTASFTLNNPVRTGYTFKGWTANETFLSPTLTVTIAQGSTKNYSFFANWEANKYNLVFNGNGGTIGGTSSGAATVLTSPQPSYDTQVVLPANPFTYTDKHFVGWNTQANGNGTTYAPGAVLSGLATGVEGDATYTLYAKWANKAAPQFSITEASKEATYSSKPQGISFSTDADTSKITITYTLANAQARLTSNNPTNAGTYDVSVSIEDPNFSSVTYSFPGAFTIKKAPLKVYYQSETIYAGHAPKWQMVFEGFVNGETTSVLDVKPTLPAVKPTALGTHEILPSGGKDDNYEIEHVAGQLIIKEKVIYVYSPDKLLQTGEAAWLIPVLAFCGVAVLAAGAWISLRKKSYER